MIAGSERENSNDNSRAYRGSREKRLVIGFMTLSVFMLRQLNLVLTPASSV